MVVFLITWYVLTIITYGVWVPAGLFVPGIMIGCSVGTVVELSYQKLTGTQLITHDDYVRAEVAILVSAAAMLTSMFRITFSLVVIMMETTSSIHIFAPMMFGCIVSSKVADMISPSFYDKVIAMKNIQILPHHPPAEMKNIEAREFMFPGPIITLPGVVKVSELKSILNQSHHAYPVVNKANNVVGLIHKKMIVCVLIAKAFYM